MGDPLLKRDLQANSRSTLTRGQSSTIKYGRMGSDHPPTPRTGEALSRKDLQETSLPYAMPYTLHLYMYKRIEHVPLLLYPHTALIALIMYWLITDYQMNGRPPLLYNTPNSLWPQWGFPVREGGHKPSLRGFHPKDTASNPSNRTWGIIPHPCQITRLPH